MAKKRFIAYIATIGVLLSACTGPGDEAGESTPEPSPSAVGTIEVGEVQTSSETGATSPTPEPAPGLNYDPGPEVDESAPVIEGETHDYAVDDETIIAATREICEEAEKWWASVGDVSRKKWIEAGRDVYAPGFVMDGYTDQAYEALVREDWDDFDTIVHPIPAWDAGACIFVRPKGQTVGLQAVTLTYLNIHENPWPGTMLHDPDTSDVAAKVRAENSLSR